MSDEYKKVLCGNQNKLSQRRSIIFDLNRNTRASASCRPLKTCGRGLENIYAYRL
jgi:hypothetical protein